MSTVDIVTVTQTGVAEGPGGHCMKVGVACKQAGATCEVWSISQALNSLDRIPTREVSP